MLRRSLLTTFWRSDLQSLIVVSIAVLVSFFLNLLVIVVIFLRRKKMEATDVFIIALAISDMMFSLAIHPMLIATSFGANSYQIFSSSGEVKVKIPFIWIICFTPGCNWYGFGAMFFGCLSMVIHGSISLVRCLPIVKPYSVHQLSVRATLLLLSLNVLYSGIFALGR